MAGMNYFLIKMNLWPDHAMTMTKNVSRDLIGRNRLNG